MSVLRGKYITKNVEHLYNFCILNLLWKKVFLVLATHRPLSLGKYFKSLPSVLCMFQSSNISRIVHVQAKDQKPFVLPLLEFYQ